MSDKPLRPADRADLIQSLAHGLRYEGRRRIHHADDFMARVAAEKLLDHLLKSGFVVMKGPGASAHSAPHMAPNKDE